MSSNELILHPHEEPNDHITVETEAEERQRRETERMGTDPIFLIMLRFALPAILGLIVHALYNSVDRIFVGQFVSAEALGAITVVFPVQVVFSSLGMMISVGGGALISIALGCREFVKAQKVLGNALSLVVVLTAICVAIGLWKTDELLLLFGTSETLLPLASQYLRILLLGLCFDMLALSANFYIRAAGRPIYGMMTLVIGAVTNIILDAVFIVGLDMGLQGAAYATVVAQFVSAVWAVSFFFRKDNPIKLVAQYLKLQWVTCRQIISVGLSACLMELAFAVLLVMLNMTITPLVGDLGISAMGIVFTLSLMLFLPIFGLMEGARPLLGYNFGAKKYERMIDTMKVTLIIAVSILVTGLTIFQLFAEQMVRIFNTNPELVMLTARGIRLSFIATVLSPVGIVTSCLYQSMAKPLPAIILSICRNCLFVLVPLIFLPPLFHIDGVWWSLVIGDVMSFLFSSILLVGQWKKLRRLSLATT